MEKTGITPESVIVRNDKSFVATPIGSEIVMMNVETGTYIGINEVATTIWNKLAEPVTVNELIDHLVATYEITREECAQKTISHLEEMRATSMVLVIK